MSPALITLAQNKGWKVAITILLTEQCNRSRWELLLRKILIRTALSGPMPRRLKQQLPWESYRRADQMIVGLEAERYVLEQVYGVEKRRVVVVPLGLLHRRCSSWISCTSASWKRCARWS